MVGTRVVADGLTLQHFLKLVAAWAHDRRIHLWPTHVSGARKDSGRTISAEPT